MYSGSYVLFIIYYSKYYRPHNVIIIKFESLRLIHNRALPTLISKLNVLSEWTFKLESVTIIPGDKVSPKNYKPDARKGGEVISWNPRPNFAGQRNKSSITRQFEISSVLAKMSFLGYFSFATPPDKVRSLRRRRNFHTPMSFTSLFAHCSLLKSTHDNRHAYCISITIRNVTIFRSSVYN